MKHQGTKQLETERLILRQFKVEDAKDMFYHWACDPEVTKYLTWSAHSDVGMTDALLNVWVEGYSNPMQYNWAIELKETHEIIGNISAVNVDERIKAVDIGYCMGKAWWDREIMPEALKRVIQFFFEEVEANRVSAGHDKNNPKSGRVMEKAGMIKEGVRRGGGCNNQGIVDIVWYAILRSEWK